MKSYSICFLLVLISFQLGCSKETEKTVSSTEKSEEISVSNIDAQTPPTINKVNIPFDFKGIKIGQTAKELKQVYKGLDYTNKKTYFTYTCVDSLYRSCNRIKGLTIANQTPTWAGFFFVEEKLALINITFDESFYNLIRDSLVKKYGAPTINDESQLQNKLTGIESKYEELAWANVDGSFLTITNHDTEGSSYVPKGILTITSDGAKKINDGTKSDAEGVNNFV